MKSRPIIHFAVISICFFSFLNDEAKGWGFPRGPIPWLPFDGMCNEALNPDQFMNERNEQPKVATALWFNAELGTPIPEIHKKGELMKALITGKKFIARSDFWREYFEASGLFESYIIDEDLIRAFFEADFVSRTDFANNPIAQALQIYKKTGSERRFTKKLLSLNPHLKEYAARIGVDFKYIFKHATFSFWGFVEGLNRTIVADNAIVGRYHLFTSSMVDGKSVYSYAVIEDGKILRFGPESMREHHLQNVESVIEFYKKQLTSKKLDPNHAYSMEIQTPPDGQHTLLQNHRTRDLEPAQFELTRTLDEGEFESNLVRGATPKGGVTIEMTMTSDLDPQARLDQYQSLVSNGNRVATVYRELGSRYRVVNFSQLSSEEAIAAMLQISNHLGKSEIFNPQLFIGGFKAITLVGALVRPEDIKSITRIGADGMERRLDVFELTVMIHVESDGRRAIVKVLGRKD